jgi:Xaa-Pro dipeptidase
MQITKRALFAAAGAAVAAGGLARAKDAPADNLAASATPIGAEERAARIDKARALMREAGIAALLVEAGSALDYFTGVKWWRSERFTGAVIPADGEAFIVTPAFEEPSVRESLQIAADVRVWNEHEDPFALVAATLADRGVKSGRIGVEETVRYFIAHGVAKAGSAFEVGDGSAIARGCRMIKSPAEIALMQTANDITLAAYRRIHPEIREGMAARDISSMMTDAMRALGGDPEFAMVLLNEASAYPHGTHMPQQVRAGGVILMDCGCSVHGYKSDVSRTFVFGEPTKKQRKVWKTVKRGQEIALDAARIGAPAGAVDDAVRRYYEREGYGPDYRLPGLSHRTGHGIGMDGHEPVNFVRGEKTPLAPGMCFSNEPGIYEFGAFGVRLEDCLTMTAKGPQLFTPLSHSLENPFG